MQTLDLAIIILFLIGNTLFGNSTAVESVFSTNSIFDSNTFQSNYPSCSERMRPAVAAAIAATRDLCAQEHAEATRLAVAATREECERDRAQAVEAAITGTRELCAIEIATYITTIYCKSKP